MAKTKKNKIESTEENKLYFFSANFRSPEGNMYIKWKGYELTTDQLKTRSRVVDICDCPPTVAKKWNCNCKK